MLTMSNISQYFQQANHGAVFCQSTNKQLLPVALWLFHWKFTPGDWSISKRASFLSFDWSTKITFVLPQPITVNHNRPKLNKTRSHQTFIHPIPNPFPAYIPLTRPDPMLTECYRVGKQPALGLGLVPARRRTRWNGDCSGMAKGRWLVGDGSAMTRRFHQRRS